MRLCRMCDLVEPVIAWVPLLEWVKQIRSGGGVFRIGAGVFARIRSLKIFIIY